jgi:hypothetical protein
MRCSDVSHEWYTTTTTSFKLSHALMSPGLKRKAVLAREIGLPPLGAGSGGAVPAV